MLKPTVEHVTEQMTLSTQEKFTLWDTVIVEDWLGNPKKSDDALILLKDPTIYAYAFFRDAKGDPFKVYPYQDIVMNDMNDRVIFAAANQIGKSVSLCLEATHFALQNPGTTTILVSQTFNQTKDRLRQIRIFLENSTLEYKYEIGDTDTKTEIYFKQFEDYLDIDEKTGEPVWKQRQLPDSRVLCLPATETVLSYSVHKLLLDELAFYEDGDYFYKQIAQPRTYATKGQIKVYSNPNGQQGIFWELWNNSRFSKYRFNFLDCPNNTQQEFDELCEGLTQEQIDSTLLATFTSPVGGFFSLQERKAMQEDRPNQLPIIVQDPLYFFYDWGKINDPTVRICGSPDGVDPASPNLTGIRVHEMKPYPLGTSYNAIIEDLEQTIREVGFGRVVMVGWDNTGVGSGIEDFIVRIRDLGVQCMPVPFSLENKSRMYTIFKLLAERNLRGKPGIKIPYLPACDKQLASLTFTKTSREYFQIHHANEKDHDDFPDALAGLCILIVQPENPPVSITIIGGGGEDDDDAIVADDDGQELTPEEEIRRFGVPLGVF